MKKSSSKRQTQSDLLPEQEEFDHLQSTIENLLKQESDLVHDFDGALQYYFVKIRPIEEALAKLLIKRCRIIYKFYKKGVEISPSEQEILRDWVWNDLMQALQVLTLGGLPEDVRQILKELHDAELEEEAKNGPQEGQGEPKGDPAHFDPHTAPPPPLEEEAEKEMTPKKSKKMRKKSLHIIYRQLAKALHPDLEPDSERKAEKEELMKQLTEAYEKDDLHALLALEEIWGDELDEAESGNCEQLQVYNEILESQVKTLEGRIHSLWSSPKYHLLHRFYPRSFEGTSTLEKVESELHSQRENLSTFVELLQSSAEEVLRKALQGK